MLQVALGRSGRRGGGRRQVEGDVEGPKDGGAAPPVSGEDGEVSARRKQCRTTPYWRDDCGAGMRDPAEHDRNQCPARPINRKRARQTVPGHTSPIAIEQQASRILARWTIPAGKL